MSPLIRQLQDGDKHQRLLRKESRLVVQLTSIRQKQTYYSGSELSWLALRLAEKISGHSLNQSEVNQNNRDSLARECIWYVLFPRFNALTGDSHLTISLFTFSRKRAARMILQADCSTPSVSLFSTLHWIPVCDIIKYKKLQLLARPYPPS